MSKISSKNTKAELVVFKELRKRKIKFRKHYKKAVGCPDIAIPDKKIAVFIDGDFWHGRNFAKTKKRLPKEYWQEKIASNIARDKRNRARLRRQGWKVLRIWESDIRKSPENIFIKTINFFKKQ